MASSMALAINSTLSKGVPILALSSSSSCPVPSAKVLVPGARKVGKTGVGGPRPGGEGGFPSSSSRPSPPSHVLGAREGERVGGLHYQQVFCALCLAPAGKVLSAREGGKTGVACGSRWGAGWAVCECEAELCTLPSRGFQICTGKLSLTCVTDTSKIK